MQIEQERGRIVPMELSTREAGRLGESNADLLITEIIRSRDPKRLDEIVTNNGNSPKVLEMVSMNPYTNDHTLIRITFKAQQLYKMCNDPDARSTLESALETSNLRLRLSALERKALLR